MSILTFKNNHIIIKKGFENYASKYKLNLIEDDIELPKIYENVKGKQALKKILLIKKHINNNKRIIWLDNSLFITSYCDSLLNVDKKKLGCYNYGELNYEKEPMLVKNLLNLNISKSKIINTSILVIPEHFKKYFTDDFIDARSLYFDYSYGDKLFFNDIIHNNNLEYEFLDYSYNSMLATENVQYQDDIELFKQKFTTDINNCNDEVKETNIFNLKDINNLYILNKILVNLANYYYTDNEIYTNKKYVGLTINNKVDEIYTCGINLNIYFWYDFVKLCGYEPILISHNINKQYVKIFDKNYNIIDAKNASSYHLFNDLKLYINIGLSITFLTQYLKNKVKIVDIILGSIFYNDILNLVGKDCINTSEVLIDLFDEIWISPHFEFSIEYLKERYRTDKIYVCPYFWEPYNLKNFQLLEFNKDNVQVAVIESNLNFYKHCVVPIMIADKKHEYIKNMKVYGSLQFKENNFFKSLVLNTDLQKNQKISFEGRYAFNHIFNKLSNCVISFSQDCDLNFVSFECMYLGIPLIHNSYMLKDYAYYYDKMSIEDASNHLESICKNFNKNEYIEKNKPILNKYSIYNEEYKVWFINRVENLIKNDKNIKIV